MPTPCQVSFKYQLYIDDAACNAGDLSSIPRLGRFPGEGQGYPLQYSGLENSMDCIGHGVTKSQTWLSDFHSLTWTWLSDFQSLIHSLTMCILWRNLSTPLSCFNHPSHTFSRSLNFPNVSSSQGSGVSCFEHLDNFSHTFTQLTPFYASPSLCVSFFQEVFFLTKPLEWLSRHPQHTPGYTLLWALLTSRHLLVICPPLLQSRGPFVLLNTVSPECRKVARSLHMP